MRVGSIELRGVTVHRDTRLQLPERGVVLLLGDNGQGKTSVIEAVPLTFWGKSLRGE